ncbi:unnamed protein product, partial [Adineta ricciae]
IVPCIGGKILFWFGKTPFFYNAVDIYIDDNNRFRPDSDSESEGELFVDHQNGAINSTDSSYEYDVPENIQLDDYQFEHGVGVIANDLTDPNTKFPEWTYIIFS